MVEISFPGLGIDWFSVKNVAFTIFGKEVMWYGIFICIGMILAYFYATTRGKFEGVSSDDLLDLAFFVILFGIVGARLYYVIFAPSSYIAKGASFWSNVWATIKNVVSVWNGGLAIFGGILAGALTAFFVARHKKIPFSKILDILAPSVMIGQIIGRWGNFMNAEAYGSETALPWRMGLRRTSAGGLYSTVTEVHPTFLYESLWNLIGFVLIAVFYKKKKFNGQVIYFYMIWYGLGRAMIEGLRSDSLLIPGTALRVSQLVAILACLTGIALMILGYHRLKNAPAPAAEAEVEADTAGEKTEDIAAEETADTTEPEESKDGSEDH